MQAETVSCVTHQSHEPLERAMKYRPWLYVARAAPDGPQRVGAGVANHRCKMKPETIRVRSVYGTVAFEKCGACGPSLPGAGAEPAAVAYRLRLPYSDLTRDCRHVSGTGCRAAPTRLQDTSRRRPRRRAPPLAPPAFVWRLHTCAAPVLLPLLPGSRSSRWASAATTRSATGSCRRRPTPRSARRSWWRCCRPVNCPPLPARLARPRLSARGRRGTSTDSTAKSWRLGPCRPRQRRPLQQPRGRLRRPAAVAAAGAPLRPPRQL